MTVNERVLRRVTGLLAVLIIVALGRPFHAASQGGDPVTQGRQALDAGRVDEAIALFERAVAADAKDPAALVERFPDAWIVYVVRGLTAVNLPAMFNKTRIAVADLGTVVAMKDRAPQAVPDAVMGAVFLNLGLAEKNGGDRARARAVWERARRLYPTALEAAAIDRELKGL
jgi:tetratricopeptide (TPR) repeat protein